MSPELGHLAVIVALCLSFFQAVVPMVGSFLGYRSWMRLGPSLALGQLVFLGLAFACLISVFIQDDFSVAYVANNSNTLLPIQYKVSAVWGAHEGSLLLWTLILAGWSSAVATRSNHMEQTFSARVLSVLGFISLGFLLFLLFTSNPFDRLLPVSPIEGRDLNPLLQDFGLIVHPPMLYMGYVGSSVPFAFAIAALIGGQFDSAWARWARPWINTAWVFLTLGISLGSWWAYYELGWGGWWFWDPVENASFMPWLMATALVHSIAATEKRGVFRSWTLLLAILSFSLSLLGAFLVRSGILTSVHSFANDPERGIFILWFLVIVVGTSLLLFALRSPQMANSTTYRQWSRETLLLINNLLLITSTATIFIGTLYPLFADVFELGKISVGAPYFNFFFVPLMILLMLALGFAGFTRWGSTDGSLLLRKGIFPGLLSFSVAALVPAMLADPFSWSAYSFTAGITIFISAWVIFMTIEDIYLKSRGKWVNTKRLTGSYWGMVVAHIGLAICALGIGISSSYDQQRDLRMMPGDAIEISNYDFRFIGVNRVDSANFVAYRGKINVSDKAGLNINLYPEKRNYKAGGQVMTEAAIDVSLLRDVYISLGEPLQGEAWAVRLQIKPLVRFIWLGSIFIGLGGLIAAFDKRYRREKKAFRNGKNGGARAYE
jgi:cytochrome c-type biogenesis protein CcmF